MITKSPTIVVLFLVLVFACAPIATAPDPGADDCYNRVTNTCNRKFPNMDYGDKAYRDCINSGLDWCDANEPMVDPSLPLLDNTGRFKVSEQ